MEHRKGLRTGRRLLVHFETRGPQRSGFTVNLSPHGMFVATSTPAPRLTPIRVRMELGGIPIEVEGLVRWVRAAMGLLSTEGPTGMGIYLPAPPPVFQHVVNQGR